MKTTKREIMLTALKLFAKKGYEATSIADIAEKLGVSKGAMYKHFDGKRQLFDSILAEMEREDAARSESKNLPSKTKAEDEASYKNAVLSDVFDFAKWQFEYWTEDEFAAAFRRLLTMEQFGSEEMQKLYENYFSAGPLGYVCDLFSEMGVKKAAENAYALWATMHLGYALSDSSNDKNKVKKQVFEMLDDVYERIKRGEK